MQRRLSLLAFVVSIGLIALVWATSGRAPRPVDAAGLQLAGRAIDITSFALGLALGLSSWWLSRIPWRELPALARALLKSWRRNLLRVGVAIACIGILFFY